MCKVDLGVGGRIILKWILKKEGVNLVHVHQKTDSWRDIVKLIKKYILNKGGGACRGSGF